MSYQKSYCSIEDLHHEVNSSKPYALSIVQTSEGPFISHHKVCELGPISLAHRTLQGSSISQVKMEGQYFTLVFPLSKAEIILDGERISNKHFILIAPGQLSYFVQNQTSEYLSIRVNAEALNESLGDLLYFDLLNALENREKKAVKLSASGNKVSSLLSVAENLLSYDWALPEKSKNDAIDSCLIYLSHIIKEEVPFLCHSRYSTRLASVKRALSDLNAMDVGKMTVVELAKKACVEVRTLELAFNYIFGLSPKKYLSLLRLHDVRARLQSQHCSSVIPVLNSCGIGNCGRFSQDYLKLFGEYPKQTLAANA